MQITLVAVLIALFLGISFYLMFASILKKFWVAPPAEPDPDDIKPVDISYYCGVCGAQVTMTMAPEGEMPAAPRHCREDMIISTPIK
ncbi:MAG: hypothetical protein KBF89_03615 [Acidimicrobiia bacterium]|nr:hypothetical protein [Acidimicrobiia bacterium]